jgi:phosphoribosylglycinamide formyltransferase, formyltetrahydrofolate-dependent
MGEPDRVSATAPFPLPRSARLAVFASGRGSNLTSLLDAFPPHATGQPRDALAHVALVISNVPNAPALDRAAEAGIARRAIPWTRDEGSRDAFEGDVQAALDEHGIDLICLAGFMRILSPDFTQRWQGRILNIHPSLLPRHPGLHAQRQALDAGDVTTGCTVHYVDAGVDTGAIVLRRSVPIHDGDDETGLAARILVEEHVAYPEAVRRVLHGRTVPLKEDTP